MNKIQIPVNDHLKILVIRLSSIGDILLSTPLIRQLKNTYKNAQIDFIIKEEFKELITDNPNLDSIYTLDLINTKYNLKGLKNQLSTVSYDIIFDLHNNIRSNYLKKGLNAKYVRTIQKNKFRQLILVHFKKDLYKNSLSIPARYLAVAADFDVKDDGKGLEFFVNGEIEGVANKIAETAGLKRNKPYICLAPGAGFFTKRWPIEYFQDVIRKIDHQLQYQVAILGDQKERELGEILSDPDDVFDFTGRLSLPETGAILSGSSALISNDSGLMHMATAVNTPVAAIFGSTVKQLGFFPYRGKSVVLENKMLSCRPCSHIGRNKCPKKHFKCMREITSGQVFTELQSLIKKNS